MRESIESFNIIDKEKREVKKSLEVEKSFEDKVKHLYLFRDWFRGVDDIVDGDKEPPPFGVGKFIEEKETLIDSLSSGKDFSAIDKSDVVLVKAFITAKERGIDVTKEIKDQLSLFKREYNAVEEKKHLVETADELITRTRFGDSTMFQLIMKILRGSFYKKFELETINKGVAQRSDWLADIAKDLKRGLITIPSEDIEQFKIDIQSIMNEKFLPDDGFKKWYFHRSQELVEDWTESQKKDNAYIEKEFKPNEKSFV